MVDVEANRSSEQQAIDSENLLIVVEELQQQLAELQEDFVALRRAIAMGAGEAHAKQFITASFPVLPEGFTMPQSEDRAVYDGPQPAISTL